MAEDVVVYSDGGGKSTAATKPIVGRAKVERFYLGLARKDHNRPPPHYERVRIDGLAGFITRDRHGTLQTTALALDGDEIAAIYMARNPDKLRRVGPAFTRPEAGNGQLSRG